ncbi:MAG TPA: L,D-transpeptidase family protein [Chitinophagaceae bacterium]|nr:L,D-transpeptidase family protein [Chitinophagaceae bacterium]
MMNLIRISPLTCIAICILTTLAISSCNNQSESNKEVGSAKDSSAGTGTVHLAFRQGIDSTNSYSNLFLDSQQVNLFISKQAIDAEKANDIRNFYNNRANQFAWFNKDGFTEQALAFRSLYDYSKDSTVKRKSLDNRLDELLNTDTLLPAVTDPDIVATELLMTWRFVNYLDQQWKNDKKKYALLTALVPYQQKPVAERWSNNKEEALPTIASKNEWLRQLEIALDQLLAVQKNGGWQMLPLSLKQYPKNKPSPQVLMLKKRLQLAGMLEAGDTTNVYTASLKTAIRKTQASYGYEHDTLLTLTLLKELNVPIENRIKQVWVNIERMRWMPDVPQKEFIYVNIPEFRMHVMNGATKLFDMNVITGKEGHGTVMFSGELNQVVFSPYWNLPENIVKKEVLPAMEKNPQYIEENHMEITGERNGLPVIRQLPGEWNELGNIKFLFPNSLNIYFHDTPHKWLFNKDQRAYSHGCIRLADAPKLAAHLLRDEPSWTAERLDSAMHADKEKYVKLREPLPVLIYYYTAWVDENGQLQFRKDIYGHDAAMAERLF